MALRNTSLLGVQCILDLFLYVCETLKLLVHRWLIISRYSWNHPGLGLDPSTALNRDRPPLYLSLSSNKHILLKQRYILLTPLSEL